MKFLKPAVILIASFIFIFGISNISLAFNPQPEPPADNAHVINPDDTKIKKENPLQNEQYQSEKGAPARLNPQFQEAITDTKPLNMDPLQGDTKLPAIQHPPDPGKNRMMQTVPSPGSDKMQEIPEEEEEGQENQALPAVQLMDQDDESSPGGPKMISPGDGSPGAPKMNLKKGAQQQIVR